MVSGEGTKDELMDFIIQVIKLHLFEVKQGFHSSGEDLVSIFPRHVPARESV